MATGTAREDAAAEAVPPARPREAGGPGHPAASQAGPAGATETAGTAGVAGSVGAAEAAGTGAAAGPPGAGAAPPQHAEAGVPMDIATARREICRVGRSLFERGHVHGTAGNVSVRLPGDEGFLVTPTDACLGFLDPERLAHVAPDGTQRSGDRASKTLALHRRIYAEDDAARCVIHTHSTHLVALTLAGVWSADDIVPPLTPYQVMKVGRVPLVGYLRPGDPAAADRVAEAIAAARGRGAPIRAVMLERLGPNVWHASPAAAMAVLEELEETARLWLTTRGVSGGAGPVPLSEACIDELRRHFGACW